MPKQLTIYVLNDYEGNTIEEKAYQCIADGYDEAGMDPMRFPDNLSMAKATFRIPAVTLHAGKPEQPEEWEVIVEGDDDDIEIYEQVLGAVE